MPSSHSTLLCNAAGNALSPYGAEQEQKRRKTNPADEQACRLPRSQEPISDESVARIKDCLRPHDCRADIGALASPIP